MKSRSFDERDTHEHKDTIERSSDTVWWGHFSSYINKHWLNLIEMPFTHSLGVF